MSSRSSTRTTLTRLPFSRASTSVRPPLFPPPVAIKRPRLTDGDARDTVRAFGYAGWLFFDNGSWLESVLGLKQRLGWNPQAIGDRAAQWWLVGLFAAIIIDLILLKKALDASKDPKKETLDLVRDVCDTAAPLFRLGLIVPNEGVVGVAGVISSVISIYQTYPRK